MKSKWITYPQTETMEEDFYISLSPSGTSETYVYFKFMSLVTVPRDKFPYQWDLVVYMPDHTKHFRFRDTKPSYEACEQTFYAYLKQMRPRYNLVELVTSPLVKHRILSHLFTSPRPIKESNHVA